MLKLRLVAASLLVIISILMSACAPDPGVEVNLLTESPEGTLRPYPSNTATPSPFPTGYQSSTPSPTVTPTPTPVYYSVQEGDDMYGIAFRYGISPQALMTANPTVNPRAMGPGTTLLIPITPGPEATATSPVTLTPTPTKPYAQLNPPDCYPDGFGGLWCFILIVNGNENALENVSATVTLFSGEDVWQQTAVMPLNMLPAGGSLPLLTYFPGPIPEDFSPSAQVDFYLPVMPGDTRYLRVEIQERSITLGENGETAEVSGVVALPDGAEGAVHIWVQATAFDQVGRVVASRRWESKGPIGPAEQMPFELVLYSLGDAIDRVELLAEAPRQVTPAPTMTLTP